MRRKSFADMDCGIAQALERIGDPWSILILREAMFGVSSFDEFHERLKLPRNTLSVKLSQLVDGGVLVRRDDPTDGRRKIYELGESGREFWVVMLALQQWGHRWALDGGAPPSFIADRAEGRPVAPLTPRDQSGAALGFDDVTMALGPGATEALKKHLAKANSKQEEPS